MHSRSILAFVLPLLLTACDAQVGSDYPGEVLVTLRGTIVNELDPAPAGPIDLLLVWNNGTDSLSTVESYPTETAVSVSFPATFTMSLFSPPPAISLNDLGELGLEDTQVGIATFVAADHGALADERSALGVDEAHLLVYVASDMDPRGLWTNFFGEPLARGFHVMDVLPPAPTEQQAAFDACHAAAATKAAESACAGHLSKIRIRAPAAESSTKITVRMAPAKDLVFPDWH
jgi:hypothetical protein